MLYCRLILSGEDCCDESSHLEVPFLILGGIPSTQSWLLRHSAFGTSSVFFFETCNECHTYFKHAFLKGNVFIHLPIFIHFSTCSWSNKRAWILMGHASGIASVGLHAILTKGFKICRSKM